MIKAWESNPGRKDGRLQTNPLGYGGTHQKLSCYKVVGPGLAQKGDWHHWISFSCDSLRHNACVLQTNRLGSTCLSKSRIQTSPVTYFSGMVALRNQYSEFWLNWYNGFCCNLWCKWINGFLVLMIKEFVFCQKRINVMEDLRVLTRSMRTGWLC